MFNRHIRRMRSLFRRAREIGPGGRALLLKTFWLLLSARIALAVIPVRKIVAFKQRPVKALPEPSAALLRDQRDRIRHAVLVVARYSPLSFVCFPQCLAASELLRRHGIESRLHYGVTRTDDKLVTHTWLEAGGEIVIGGEVAADYSTLAIY